MPPDGVLVRSMGEARIASTLHLAGIDYRYEAEFPLPDEHRSDKGERYCPDFQDGTHGDGQCPQRAEMRRLHPPNAAAG